MRRVDTMTIRAKRAVMALLSSPASGRVVGTLTRDRVRNNGVVFDTRDPVFTAKTKAMLFWRLYERTEIRFIRRYLRGSQKVIDIGGSLGITGAHILRLLPPEGELVCVEANEHLLPVLHHTLEQHAGGRSFRIVHGALTYDWGEKGAPFAVGSATWASHVGSSLQGASQVVPAVTLADVAGEGEFALVCDIEGAEAELIADEREALARCHTAVMELHHTSFRGGMVTVEEMIRSLTEVHGFRVLERRGNVVALSRR